MNELCVWFQTNRKEEEFQSLAKTLKEAVKSLKKEELNLDLIEIEELAIEYKKEMKINENHWY